MESTGLSWHFLKGDSYPVLRNGEPLVIGAWLEHCDPIKICTSGLHSSARAIDALYYAPGPWASLVETTGDEQWKKDKLVSARRRALWCYNANDELRRFARACALEVTHLWDPPPGVLQWLETGDPALRSVAWSVADAAAWSAANATAWSVEHEKQNNMLEQVLIQGAIERGLW